MNLIELSKTKSEAQKLVANLDDEKFIAHLRLADVLGNDNLLPILNEHLRSIVKKDGKNYCLFGARKSF